jgi:hypothetical protein
MIIGRKRTLWTGLPAAFRHGGKRGVRAYLHFRTQAASQPPLMVDEADWIRSGLLDQSELRALRNARLVFLLPSASPGGGTNVVLTESRCLRSMGVDVWIANLDVGRSGFAPLLRPDDPPAIYLSEFSSFGALAHEFDVVVATAWWTALELRGFAAIDRPPTLAYYVQDFEPYFYASDEEQHRLARASYRLAEKCILFTKTNWTQQEVLREEGVRAAVIGPSYDQAAFSIEGRSPRESTIRICAMVRPDTPRRAPEVTMRVLKSLKQLHGERVHISVFGCSSDSLAAASLDAGFSFENLGVLVGAQVAQLLRRSDIFLDLSTFQAMGLTAMEAMACGVAVVGPRRGGLAEIVEHGASGLLVDTLDEQACVAAASMLIDDPSLMDRMAAAGHRSVLQYAPQKAAARMARLLLLGRGAPTK